MEREKEILKLVNVLRRTGRMALHSQWTGDDKDAAAFCASRYNRVLARLKEIDEGVQSVFEPLAPDSSFSVTAMACRQLVAYYEDELGPAARFGKAYGVAFDPQTFKDFWHKSGREIEDLGEFIRESIAEWSRRYKGGREGHKKEEGQRAQSAPPCE